MKNKFFIGLMAIGFSAMLLTSCAKAPQAEIDAATAAIDEAKAAGADIYQHDNYVALNDSLKGVMVTIEAQKSKFIKDYSPAKEQLAGITALAQEVWQQTESRKQEMQVQIVDAVTEVKAMIETDRQLLLQAPKGKEGTAALLAIAGELDLLEGTVQEVNQMVENGDYMDAFDKISAAREKTAFINTELSDAISKYKGNVKIKRG